MMEEIWIDGKLYIVERGIEARMCPICFATNEATNEFCRNCGAKLIMLSYEQEDLILEEGRERKSGEGGENEDIYWEVRKHGNRRSIGN